VERDGTARGTVTGGTIADIVTWEISLVVIDPTDHDAVLACGEIAA
jgi:hypothetical protein